MMKEILDRRITTKLSLAVSLIDDYTKRQEILGKAKVSIPSLRLEAVKNLSGYYNFFNIPASTQKLQITSYYYMDKEVDNIAIPASGFIEETVNLPPGPLYPFPSWATLIRGTVKDLSGNSIAGAKIEVVKVGVAPYTLDTKTTPRGQFVLYFPIDQEDATIEFKVTHIGPASIINGAIKKWETKTMTVTI